MKKITLYSLIFGLSALFFTCKKGEDDPAFTLLTRKERLTGNWKMVSGSITIGIKDSTGAYGALVYKLDESRYNVDEIGKAASFKADCNLNISFTKKGVITFKQLMDSLAIEATGTWDFQGRVGHNKNKESIIIKLNSISNYSNRYRTFNKAQMEFVYRIKELRNKRLVLVSDQEMIELDRGAGVYITSAYTFVK